MIFAADLLHLPVSTTHVLSSGVAGTMVANKSGLEPSTVRSIALAWVLTLPVTILLSGGLFPADGGAGHCAAKESLLRPRRNTVYQIVQMMCPAFEIRQITNWRTRSTVA